MTKGEQLSRLYLLALILNVELGIMALKLGSWNMYQQSQVCSSEQTDATTLPVELIVGSYVTSSQIICLNQCQSNSRCGSVTLNLDTETCLFIDRDIYACDPGGDGAFIKVRSDHCSNGGSRVDDSLCECPSGWAGDFCDYVNPDECSSIPCQNGGSCDDYIGYYTCHCQAGYTDTHCSENINECSSAPCSVGGTCNDAVNGYSCSCYAGYAGTHCEPINECASSPCNSGNCVDAHNSYTCQCYDNYSGTHCDNYNECVSNPCLHGTCTDYINYYTCSCYTNYSGTLCDNYNECASNPCQQGTCTDYINYFTCTCTSGYSGTLCNVAPTQGSVYLSYGSYGIVYVQYNGAYGTVCDDHFDQNNNGCVVVCRQLGYTYGIFIRCGAGTGEILLDDVLCTGYESQLIQCPNPGWMVDNCSHGEDVGCRCCNTDSTCGSQTTC